MNSLFQRVLGVFSHSTSRETLTPELGFWKWFERHGGVLFDFEKDQGTIFKLLSAEMHNVHPDLTFEFGPKEDGRREFIISADGSKKAFPVVESLYEAAPPLPQWKIIKFRPRRKPFDILLDGVRVDAKSVTVDVESTGTKADVSVCIPGYSEAARQTYGAIAFLFLDQALGEFDVEMRVGVVDVQAISRDAQHTIPLEALPKKFDDLFPSN